MSCSFASSGSIFFNLDRHLSLPTARWVQMSVTWSENVRLLSNIRPRVLTFSTLPSPLNLTLTTGELELEWAEARVCTLG